MNRKAISRISYLTMLAIVCIAAGLWFFALRSSGSVVRLPDGTELRLLGVTVGMNQFLLDPLWQRAARRVLPPRYAVRIPQPIAASCGWTNSITVWLQLRDPVYRTNLHQDWGRLETVSDFGEVWRADGGSGCASDRGGLLHGYVLQNFARRQQDFLLRVYGTNQVLLASLRVPNPCRGSFPIWTPEPLPVTKTNGDLAVTFDGITKLLEENPPGKTNAFFHADFIFQQKLIPTTDWNAGKCWLEDSTGNSIGGMMPGLSERERVWHLRQWFYRKADASFSSDEHLVITNLTIPAPGNFADLNVVTNLQGIVVCLFTWTGAAALTCSNGVIIGAAPPEKQELNWSELSWRADPVSCVRRLNFGRPALLVAHQSNPDYEVRFVFRDERGKQVGVMNPWSGSFLADRLWGRQSMPSSAPLAPDLSAFSVATLNQGGLVLQPEIPSGVRVLSLEVIVQRLRMLEFFVEPPKRVKWIGLNAEERNRRAK